MPTTTDAKTVIDFSPRDKWNLPRAANAKGLEFRFLENGAVFSVSKSGIMINQALPSPLDGSLGGLWIRRKTGARMSFFPAMGPAAGTEFLTASDGALWRGRRDGLEFSCRLRLAADDAVWFWTVRVRNTGKTPAVLDAVLAQDLGLSPDASLRNNEAYASQYIDHTAVPHPQFGPLMCSRQGQKQPTGFPWVMHGCLDKTVGTLTDGFQFYGLSYKETGIPAALSLPKLSGKRLQFEFALPTLQAAPKRVAPGKEAEWTFFGLFDENHPDATGSRDGALVKRVLAARGGPAASESFSAVTGGAASLFVQAPLVPTRDLKPGEVDALFGKARRHEEKGLSFFTGGDRYVSLKKKELLLDRPHGHILRTGQHVTPSEDTLATTAWGYGAFHSHVVIGNTSFNKLLSISRNPLNVLRSGGQRVFVKGKGGWELLGVPSALEMGPHHVVWTYKTRDGRDITVKTWASPDNPACFLELSAKGAPAEFLISHFVVLGNHEMDHPGRVEIEGARATFTPAAGDFLDSHYPGTRYHISSPDAAAVAEVGGDELLYADGRRRNAPFVVFRTRPVKTFSLAISGHLTDAARADALARKGVEPFRECLEASGRFWSELRRGAALRLPGEDGVSKLNDLLPWYVHNAMIHFTSPHGLEQFSGAAWGLRDVCQGPAEFLVSTRRFPELKETLKVVFSHQSPVTGDWPQWFMFDKYRGIRDKDSHGDIIIWPIKALCDYVENTGDASVLDEEVPYADMKSGMPAGKPETLWKHVEKELDGIRAGCVGDTALYHYGHGDWEDTLQPADPAMREHMVSTWTVELCYQTLRRFAWVCRRAGRDAQATEIDAFCDRILADFNTHLVKDGVVAGLVYFRDGTPDYMLHPRDKKTGVNYRLLPMTRGMISGVFTPDQAKSHLAIIRKHLLFPDGVRLTDKPIPYAGGVEKYFKRAETAANFGREIGMHYVHAHIRYMEALAALGEAEDLYKALLLICPITPKKACKTAGYRQSNAYFSSSDAAFPDRYEAYKKFGDIKKGKVAVNGGWRVYSSGPGIYIHQLIAQFLGLRRLFDDLVFDPVMPKKLDGLSFDFEHEGKKVTFVFHVSGRTYSPTSVEVNGRAVEAAARYAENPYRRGGLLVSKKAFDALLDRPKNRVDIRL